MPNPHFRVNHISRASGQNAVASAAYRAGETLYDYRSPVNAAAYQAGETLADERRGQVFSFVRKEGVLANEIYAPQDAPEWAHDREALWNAVEQAEDKSTRRATARLARDFVASLPRELSHEEHRTLVSRFVQDQFTRKGLVADVAFHEVKARDGGKNPHVHMMVTTREIGPEGFGAKARWMDKKETLVRWRTSWEHHTNRLLEAGGHEERLSLQTYAAQGIDKVGRKSLTREEYVLESKGTHTLRGDENRRIAAENSLRDERRRLAQAESGDAGRAAWFASFSYQFGGSMDAARDALHRFRAKDVEKEAEKEVATMSDDNTQRLYQQQREALADGGNNGGTYDLQAARNQDMSARWSDAMARTPVQYQGHESDGNLGTKARPLTPTKGQTNETERYRGMTADGNDSPQQGPSTPPAGVAHGASSQAAGNAQGMSRPHPKLSFAKHVSDEVRTADISARLTDAAHSPEALAAGATIQQHINATVRQAQAAKGQEADLQGFYDRHGGAANNADKRLEQTRTQTQERDRDGR